LPATITQNIIPTSRSEILILIVAASHQDCRATAGRFAFLLFAGGIIGTGLLALPSLAGSAAYAIGEVARRPVGLDKRLGRAPAF